MIKTFKAAFVLTFIDIAGFIGKVDLFYQTQEPFDENYFNWAAIGSSPFAALNCDISSLSVNLMLFIRRLNGFRWASDFEAYWRRHNSEFY